MFKRIMNYFSPISQPAKAILESFEEEGRWTATKDYRLVSWVVIDSVTGLFFLVSEHKEGRFNLNVFSVKDKLSFISWVEKKLIERECIRVARKARDKKMLEIKEQRNKAVEAEKEEYMKLYVKLDNEQ